MAKYILLLVPIQECMQVRLRPVTYKFTNYGRSGKATVAGLAAHGARVFMGARNESKALAAIADIQKELPDADIRFLYMDLASLESVVAAAGSICRYIMSLLQ